MPYSLKIDYYSSEILDDRYFQNSDLNAFALKFIKASDPGLAAEFHDQKVNKAITVRKVFQKQNNLSLRLTLLDESLFDRFANVMISSCIPAFSLNNVDMRVAKISCSEQSESFWARFTPYEKLYREASREERVFKFKLVTPLAFKTGDISVVFPEPVLLFQSLLRRWNEFSEFKLDKGLFDTGKSSLIITGFNNLRTQGVMVKGIKHTGAVGEIEISIPGRLPEELIHQLNVLADFAYFAGAGVKTAMGMGQMHRLVKGEK